MLVFKVNIIVIKVNSKLAKNIVIFILWQDKHNHDLCFAIYVVDFLAFESVFIFLLFASLSLFIYLSYGKVSKCDHSNNSLEGLV